LIESGLANLKLFEVTFEIGDGELNNEVVFGTLSLSAKYQNN